MRLYLHSDLCKAEGASGKFGATRHGSDPEWGKKRARGVETPQMRVRATSHKKTGGMQRMVGRLEREYAGEVHNKPAYKCKDCGTHVMPPKKETIDRRLSVDEHLDHEKAGRDVRDHKDRDATTIFHPPKMVRGGKLVQLEHGAVTAEMLPSKNTRTGKVSPGVCPDCHAGEGGVKKSVDLLDQLVPVYHSSPEELVLKSYHSMRSNVWEWSNQFCGTPLEVEALRCLKDQLVVERECVGNREKETSWSELDKLPRAERDKIQAAQDKKRDELSKKKDSIDKQKKDLELKLVDHRMTQAKDRLGKSEEFGKPVSRREGESSNEFMSRIIRHLVEDKGYDQKRAVAAAYRMTDHPKAGNKVKKSIPLILTV